MKVVLLISDKLNFKIKGVVWNKKGHFTTINGLIFQKDINNP
jgi:hypothetical protein